MQVPSWITEGIYKLLFWYFNLLSFFILLPLFLLSLAYALWLTPSVFFLAGETGFKPCYLEVLKVVKGKLHQPEEIRGSSFYAFSYYYDRAADTNLIGKFGIFYCTWACQQERRQRNPGGWSHGEQRKGMLLRKRTHTKCLKGMTFICHCSLAFSIQHMKCAQGSSYTCSSVFCSKEVSLLVQHHWVAL